MRNCQNKEKGERKTMRYYAIEFWSRNKKGCTTGNPNNRTGRLSIACDAFGFSNKEDRKAFLEGSSFDRPRINANRKTIRSCNLGMSVSNFEDYFNRL